MVTLKTLFACAVDAADPVLRLPSYLPHQPTGLTIVLGAGKAAARMAQVFEQNASHPYSGLVVGPADESIELNHIEYLAGSHPIPSQDSVAAGQALLERAAQASPQDQVIFLLSGGASALIATPPDGIELSELQEITRLMLNGGANIAQLNAVRRCISAVAGGRLAAVCAAPVLTLAISDVTGDVPCDIGSGPTCQNPTTPAQVIALLNQFEIPISNALAEFLSSPQAHPTITPGPFELIATPQQSLAAAQQMAEQSGLNVLNLGGFIEGDANETAKVLGGIAQQIAAYDSPVAKPAVILSGGETSVRVTGNGQGGRNVQFLMSLAKVLASQSGISALACDTDGVDGALPIAGAVIDSTTLHRAQAMGYPVDLAIANNDGHRWFEQLGDQVVTGPTQTNVNDFRAILIQ